MSIFYEMHCIFHTHVRLSQGSPHMLSDWQAFRSVEVYSPFSSMMKSPKGEACLPAIQLRDVSNSSSCVSGVIVCVNEGDNLGFRQICPLD